MATAVWGEQRGTGLGLIPSNENPPINPPLPRDQAELLNQLRQRVDNEWTAVVNDAHHLQTLEHAVNRLEQNLIAGAAGDGSGGLAENNERIAGQQRQINRQEKEQKSATGCMKVLKIILFIFLVLIGGAILL